MITSLFGVLFDGFAYGMLLFLLSVGLSVTLGMMNFVNLAHCTFAMIGGYVTVTLMNHAGWPFLATLPLAFVAAEGPWEATAVPGIEARKLFVDEPNDRVTMLVRMAPGAAYPSHRHAGPEECYVLQGDLRTGDVVQHAGEYQRAAMGSVHPSQSTEGGCVLLIVSSLHDTLLAA